MSEPNPRIADQTREQDRRDARTPPGPDREPTEEEERIAEELLEEQPLTEEVARTYKEQAELGAATEGEGRIP